MRDPDELKETSKLFSLTHWKGSYEDERDVAIESMIQE